MPEFALDKRYVNVTGDTMTGTLNAQNILPSADSTYDLGSSSYKWRDAYIRGSLYGNKYFTLDNNAITTKFLTRAGTSPNTHFHLFADYTKPADATDVRVFFGCNSDIRRYEFLSVWSGSNETLLKLDGEELVNYSRSFLPFADNTHSLGSSSYRWKEVHGVEGYFGAKVDGLEGGGIVAGGTSGGRHLIINDVDGARWSIATGSYDLTFYKHRRDTDTWVELLRLEGDDPDSDPQGMTLSGNLTVGSSTSNKIITVYGSINGRRNSDGTNASMLNLYNQTSGREWHIPVRASEGDRLNFYFWDGGSWHTVMKLNWNPERVEVKDVVPMSDNTYSLGNSSLMWKNAWVKDTLYCDGLIRVSGYPVGTTLRVVGAGGGEPKIEFGENVRWQIEYRSGSADKRLVYWFYNGSSYLNRYYFKNDGHAYADGGWHTFCPVVGDDESELVSVVSGEVEKEYPDRDENGRIICPVCGKPIGYPDEGDVCDDPSHFEEVERRYGRDLAKISIAGGKLALKLREKVALLQGVIDELRKENEELRKRVEYLEGVVSKLMGVDGS